MSADDQRRRVYPPREAGELSLHVVRPVTHVDLCLDAREARGQLFEPRVGAPHERRTQLLEDRKSVV